MGMRTMSWVVCAVCLVVGANTSQADDKLKGLGSVVVMVQLEDECKKIGLTESRCRTDIELRLRQAGIPVRQADNGKNTNPSVGILYCYITVVALRRSDDSLSGYAFRIDQDLYQNAKLVWNPSIHLGASTWERSALKAGPVRGTKGSIRETIRDMADEFCNAYLAANPKGQSAKVKESDAQAVELPPACNRVSLFDVREEIERCIVFEPYEELDAALEFVETFCGLFYFQDEQKAQRLDCEACQEALIRRAYTAARVRTVFEAYVKRNPNVELGDALGFVRTHCKELYPQIKWRRADCQTCGEAVIWRAVYSALYRSTIALANAPTAAALHPACKLFEHSHTYILRGDFARHFETFPLHNLDEALRSVKDTCEIYFEEDERRRADCEACGAAVITQDYLAVRNVHLAPCKRLGLSDEAIWIIIEGFVARKPIIGPIAALSSAGKGFCRAYKDERKLADCQACEKALIRIAYAESP